MGCKMIILKNKGSRFAFIEVLCNSSLTVIMHITNGL